MANKIVNLKGMKFGRLKVIKYTNERKRRNVIWLCQCECGKIVKIKSNDLIRGNIKSCGCLISSIEFRKKISDVTKGEKNPNYGKRGSDASGWKGGRRKSSKGYIELYLPSHPFASKSNLISEHRLIMERMIGRYLNQKEVVHHKNGIPYDNRSENLMLISNKNLHKQIHQKGNEWILLGLNI